MKNLILLFLALFFIGFGHFIFSVENDSQVQTTQINEEQEAVTNENEVEALFESAEQSSIINPVSQDVETLKVTGSRIRRIDLEGPSPTTIWTKEDLDNKGYFNVGEFFTNTSLSNFGTVRIHNRSTLTLVNGSRMVYGEAGNPLNGFPKKVIDIIPKVAIERVETLKDGSSALYGSDVVGGVVNIITKKDLDSPEISLKLAPTLYPLYKGGSRAETSFVFGKQFNKWHFISASQFQYSEGIKQSDRKKWYGSDPILYSSYPSFQTGPNALVIDSRCPDKNKTQQGCSHDLLPYNYITPNIYELSSYNYVEYKWNSDISLYSQWLGFWQRFTEPDQPFYDDLKLPAGHKMSMGNGSAGILKYLFEGSDRLSDSIFLDGLVGVKGYISKTWDFDFSLKWSNVLDRTIKKDYLYKEDLTKAIVSGSYDPFNPEIRDLNSVRRHDVTYKNNDAKIFTSLDFSGETGFWDIDMALGLQAHYNNYKHIFDPTVKEDKIFAQRPGATGEKFERTILAAYMEGIKSFSNWLEVQLAGRIDHYSDFGLTVNPKLAVRFQPISQLMFRSSIGTSFEAPGLQYLYTPAVDGIPIGIHDAVACYNELKQEKHFAPIYNSLTGENFHSQSEKDKLVKEFLIEQSSVWENKKLPDSVKTAFKGLTGKISEATSCNVQRVKGVFKGNKDLKETKALTASFGFHWQLHENHSLKVDSWFNSLSGIPAFSFATKKTTQAELRYGKKYVEDQGVQYERDNTSPYTSIKNPVATFINVSERKLYGVDAKWESDFLNWTVAGGNLYFKDQFAYVIKAGVENFKGMGFINNLGKSMPHGNAIYSLPRWRNFATFGWKNPKHDISLVFKNVAGVKKAFDESETLPMSYIVDLFYQYNMNPKTSLKFGWFNLLFSEPVLDDSVKQGAKFDERLFDFRGPYFFAELRRSL